MARVPRGRLVHQNSVNHCSWRSHDHEIVFATDDERVRFLGLLREHKRKHGVLIVSYCLMGTHPHVICVATRGQVEFSAFWRVVNARYARWYNTRHGRRGQVVMERLSSPRIQDDRHLLTAMRYGDLNPVKAGLARRAAEWRWSSHRHYALGDPDDIVDEPEAFLALGRTGAQRRRAYRHLFALKRDDGDVLRSDGRRAIPLFIGDAWWVQLQLAAIARVGDT